ncbi:hypothetical protein T439DRAFT_283415 [Meredithblackwellia eburnea MCA 4105]
MSPINRLSTLSSTLAVAPAERELLGTLTLGSVPLPIYNPTASLVPRLPRTNHLLDITDPTILESLEWIAKKITLGQDIFLLSPPSPLPRRLIHTYLALTKTPYEHIMLHRDTGESELKQGRELRVGGRLEFVDGPAVRAAKVGGVLVLEGIERCERGVLPILNNLLENREINLEDGTHIISTPRYNLMLKNNEDTTNFIPAHPDFRVVAIGSPVPPYPGNPLDPPFRSRFQVRYLDPVKGGTLRPWIGEEELEYDRRGESESEGFIEGLGGDNGPHADHQGNAFVYVFRPYLPSFPSTTLLKAHLLLTAFPPPSPHLVKTREFVMFLIHLNPLLAYATPEQWRVLENLVGEVGLTAWMGEMAGLSECDFTEGVDGTGIWGYNLSAVSPHATSPLLATLKFSHPLTSRTLSLAAPRGSGPLRPLPTSLHPRVQSTLTSLIQLHSLPSSQFNILFTPTTNSLQGSSGSSGIVIDSFARCLGYEGSAGGAGRETVHLVKELSGGRELVLRGKDDEGLDTRRTGWEPSPLLKGVWEGTLVQFEGIDQIGATIGSLGRLLNEKEGELWEGKRLVGRFIPGDESSPELSLAHPSFRLLATATKSTPPREWLTEEISSIFFALPVILMSSSEETSLLLSTGCPPSLGERMIAFAQAYRRANGGQGNKSRRLGTATILRMGRRLSLEGERGADGVYELINRALLSEFLPPTTKGELESLLEEYGFERGRLLWNPPPVISTSSLTFPAASDPSSLTQDLVVPLFDITQDPTGSSHIPFMDNFLDNSQQTRLMRDIACDLEVLGEHVLLLGNQGVGKNKIIDRLLQLLRRPREFIQLHRDSTPQSLMFQTSLEGGIIKYVDSPLIRAVKLGRVIVIDETDKAAAHVVASLASLASRGEMTLPDGRRIRPPTEEDSAGPSDIIVHPNFRMILLANRPGFPFLGNPFLRVLGDNFSCYAVTNPDQDSEQRVLQQLAPDLEPELLKSLVLAFADLRKAFEAGTLPYPFSLRELLALVRHLKKFPEDELEQVLRNVFDFDINRPETLDALYDILRKHKLRVERIGIDAARGGPSATGEGKKPVVIEFKPKGDTSLSEPKFGKNPDGKSHTGGNTWAGGTGGRDTAGLGGRGGYMRLATGQDISQIPDQLKEDVPEHIKAKAREMARKELAARLAEIDLSSGQASTYSGYHNAVQSHVHQLVTFLDNLEAKEEERVWLKRQSEGDLDESRLPDGLTGERSIYKRRGMEKPELGAPQLKPKRIRFIFDLSASMYRNQYDGRLTRSLEAAVMILESFSRLTRKEKYRIDLVGQSGEEAVIPLVPVDKLPTDAGERYKVIQKMAVVPQYAWAGDHTVEAIKQGVADCVESDSDDYFVITITDANFSRYGITAEDLKLSMDSNPKVKCSLIAIGEGAEAAWLPKALPGRAYRVMNTTDIATHLRAILGQMLGGGL